MKTLLVIAWVLAVGGLDAQSQPTFEVASVKPGGADASRTETGFSGGRFSVESRTLSFIIQQAYGLRDFQLVVGRKSSVD